MSKQTKQSVFTASADSKLGNIGGWQDRHNAAITNPHFGFEQAMVKMVHGWNEYAETHNRRFQSTIGEDYVLGPQWQAIGEGMLGLLNGETGRLDCGTLDGFIRNTLEKNKVEVAS